MNRCSISLRHEAQPVHLSINTRTVISVSSTFENKCYRNIFRVSRTEHRTNHSIADELEVTSGTLLDFILKTKAKIKLFWTYNKKTPNTGEITRRKIERLKKQRKTKVILGEGCGGLDGGRCLESGTNSRRSADV